LSKIQDSIKIVKGIREGNNLIVEYFIRNCKSAIIRLGREYGNNDADAEDIFQDGLLRLIEMVNEDSFKLTSELSTLLYAICDKMCKLRLEKESISRRYFQRKLVEDEDPDITQEIDQQIYNRIYRESFNKLPKDSQRILNAILKEIPLKEIAYTMGYSYDYLRRKKRLILDKLRDLIEKHKDYKLIKDKEGIVKLY